MVDPELLAALLDADDDDLESVVDSLAPEYIQALLGDLGADKTADEQMPASVVAQAQELDPGYVVRPHLQLLSDRLDDAIARVEAGQNVKMLVSMPPRHGKTELGSVYLPIYLLRRNHKTKIGIISHSPNLAATWGRRVRRVVERFGSMLGLSIAPDAGAVSEWETAEGGGVTSRSIGQALAGVGFNVLIVDDPTRDFAAAHSDSARQAVWDWWTVNAVTRLEPPSLVIVIQTRWHEDDLTGRLLSTEYDGDPSEWEQVIIPAIADHDPKKGETDPLGRAPGEPLLSPLIPNETPEQALERLEGLRRSIGSYAWAALFQQQPAPEQGAIFNVGWWRYWTSNPTLATEDGRVRYFTPEQLSAARVVDSWDATFKDTKDSDYVVGQRWAVVGANRVLLAQKRGRWSFTKTIEEMVAWVTSGPYFEGVHERFVEDKANGPAIIDSLRDRVPGLIPVNPQGSKEARARAVTPEIESGNVYLPLESEAPWVRDLIAEARSFPSGKHDDMVDSLSQALSKLRSGGRGGVTNPATAQRTTTTPAAAKLLQARTTGTRASAARTTRRPAVDDLRPAY